MRMARPACTGLLTLLALVALLATPNRALTRNDLYPYAGPDSNVLRNDANGVLASAELQLGTPISFYDKVYNSIFVNGNGVISFIRAMQRFFNIAFPLDDPVIAPLYTHVDTRASGQVHYVETTAPDVISRAGGIVRGAFKNAMDFVPTHVFIATWIDVGYYNEKNDKVNTYQVIISSNGTHSYVELLYPENSIQWIQGESHPSGLPDAKAQAGFMSEGKIYTLKGSGTDLIQNIDKWSNVGRPGQWVFQVGPLAEGENVRLPDDAEDNATWNQVTSCRTGATTCHSKATCVDYEVGFCCSCKPGFFGNGRSCQPNDVPLRVIGRVSGTVNGVEFPAKDLQCYVQTKDGRTYTAVSRVPQEVGAEFQLLGNLGGVIGWLFAKPVAETRNGYELTGGLFNHTTELTFAETGDQLTIRSKYMGLDVFGQLRMEAEIKGSLPRLASNARVDCGDHDELYTRAQPGTIRSQTERKCNVIQDGQEREYSFTQDQTIIFNECIYAPSMSDADTTRLKFNRGITTYESTEGIIRYAVNTKIAPLEEEDPCIQGRATCGPHSSCVVDGDDFKCVCNPGYQYLYEENGSAICVDVDECTAGNHVCSTNAQCVNQEGSHSCHCRPGFSGDGRHCERVTSCDDTQCLDYEQCQVINGEPTCVCIPGFEETEQGCYPIQHVSCNIEPNCSPNGICSYDGNRQKHVCVCLPGFVGDGYTCYSEMEATTSDVPPEPRCLVGMCWCPSGWDYYENSCVKSDNLPTTDNDRDLLARPLAECLEGNCVCPWGYDYYQPEEICIPRPGLNLTTMGASGSHLSCNVVNTCHPYAQCVYVTEDEENYYTCRCNIGYEGDGIMCTRTEISCLEVDICDPNASCRHEEPLAKCICNPGYEGDGTSCRPIDECNEDSKCKENERCTYNPVSSRYECMCNPGYSMVDGLCIVSDCSTNPSQCHLNAQCVSTGVGGYKCSCISGYHGDGIRMCVEDHIGCNVLNNCGRNALCGYNQTSTNYACICQPGFYGDGYTCLPESSCRRDPSLCSSDATCTPAGNNQYACICNEGFTGDGHVCKHRPKHDANFLLVNQGSATHRIPFAPSPSNPGSPIYMVFNQMAIAIDIDCLHGKAYYSDITGNRIVELSYNGSVAETFVPNVSSPEGIAVDWVSRNIFWTDPGKATVEVANLKTKKRKVLISDGLVNPRGIAVHPYRGKVFWSDWNRAAPKIEWANEDGTGRSVFIQGDNVKLPNSLSIDWSTDELCWTDAGTFTISCIEVDSKQIHVVAEKLTYPFGLAISQNNYYWTDWKTHKVEVAMKTSGERKTAISIPAGGSGKLYGLVAVPETCPRVTNVCQYENGRCSEDQLCLPDGQGGRTCACADNASVPCTDSRYPS